MAELLRIAVRLLWLGGEAPGVGPAYLDVGAPTLGIAELPIMLRPGRVTDPDGRVGGGLTHDQRQAGQLPCLTVRLGERANRSNEHGRDGDGLSFGY